MKRQILCHESDISNALCSVSGGADSDVMLDLIYKVDFDKKVEYVWFDTGMEYQATKDHLVYLEDRYNIDIKRIPAEKSIPWSCKHKGQPFISKIVSGQIEGLQKHNFDWQDKDFEMLKDNYGRCNSYLKWFCGVYTMKDGKPGFHNIKRNKLLKEFILSNPPEFSVSSKCCDYAKKDVAKHYLKDNNIEMRIIGVRRSEGGVRAVAYNNCFSPNKNKGFKEYRPLFWYTNQDKIDYENEYGIIHSRCYTEYGLTRTGCVGCPYNRKLLDDLHIIQRHEPKLYNACCNIFKDSYEYTKQYRQFIQQNS